MITKKELALAERLNLLGIEIEENIKRAYYDNHSKVINQKTNFFENMCLLAETFTHYVPGVVSKRKFYRLAIIVNEKVEYEYYGVDAQQMNECYLKLKKHCES